MDYEMNVINVVLSYWSNDDNGLGAIEIKIPPEIIDIDLNDEYYESSINYGFLRRNVNFKSARIKINRRKDSIIPWSIDETIDAIKDFLYKDKWDQMCINIEFAGKHNVFNERGMKKDFSIRFDRKDLQILEISDKDKEDSVKLSFMFNK